MIRFLERTARDGTATDGYYILRLRHLVVQTLEHRYHLVYDGAETEDYVCLTRRVTRNLPAETRKVESCRSEAHKLDTATRSGKRQGPHRITSCLSVAGRSLKAKLL